MNASQAGDAVSAYLQPVYGFALRRCASEQDAQDVTQEILLKVYRALLLRDDIASVPAFLWTTARHVLANYYRGRPKNGIGAGLDELADRVASEEDIAERVAAADRPACAGRSPTFPACAAGSSWPITTRRSRRMRSPGSSGSPSAR